MSFVHFQITTLHKLGIRVTENLLKVTSEDVENGGIIFVLFAWESADDRECTVLRMTG